MAEALTAEVGDASPGERLQGDVAFRDVRCGALTAGVATVASGRTPTAARARVRAGGGVVDRHTN